MYWISLIIAYAAAGAWFAGYEYRGLVWENDRLGAFLWSLLEGALWPIWLIPVVVCRLNRWAHGASWENRRRFRP